MPSVARAFTGRYHASNPEATMLLLLAVARAFAACPADAAVLRADAGAAIAAYTAFDLDRFRALRAAVAEDVGCLTEVAGRADAGDVHLVEAIGAFLDDDTARLQAAGRALLVVRPERADDPAISPPGSRLADAFAQARAAGPGPAVPLAEGWLFVDGEAGKREIPAERAAIVQHTDAGGRVRTWYLAGGPLPDKLPGLHATEAPVAESGHGSRRLLVAGGVTGGVAALSLVLSARAETAFWDTRSEDRAERLYRANRFFGFTGAGLGVAAGAFVTGALIQGEW